MPPAYEVLLLNTAIPQIQAAQSGDTYVVPRDIAFSTQTQNGVPYFTGTSKTLTSGSALTFDGTTLATTNVKLNTSGAIVDGAGNTVLAPTGGGSLTIVSNSSYTNGNIVYNALAASGLHVWQINSGEQMRFTTTGLGIGLGGGSPTKKLEVSGTVRATVDSGSAAAIDLTYSSSTRTIHALETGGSNARPLRILAQSLTYADDSSTRLVVDTSGNVGIGTSSPSVTLDVKQPTAGQDLIVGLSAGTGARAQIRSIAQATSSSSELGFYTTTGGSTNERVRIDTSGNVGIGTASPTAIGSYNSVTVNGSSGSLFDLYVGGTIYGRIRGTSNTMAVLSQGVSSVLLLGTDNTERARISSDGTFRVKGAGTAGSTDAVQISGSAPASAVTLNASGALLIGLTTSSALNSKLYVSSGLGQAAIGSSAITGTGALDTGISINQVASGGCMILIASRNTGAGTNTDAAVYIVRFYYDGNNAPTTVYVGGSSDFVTFGVSGTNTLTLTNAGGGNAAYAWLGNK